MASTPKRKIDVEFQRGWNQAIDAVLDLLKSEAAIERQLDNCQQAECLDDLALFMKAWWRQ